MSICNYQVYLKSIAFQNHCQAVSPAEFQPGVTAAGKTFLQQFPRVRQSTFSCRQKDSGLYPAFATPHHSLSQARLHGPTASPVSGVL